MFKNMFTRAALSVRRKISRTIIIALTFFVISNLILAAIIIKTATRETTEFAQASLGGTVTLQADMANLRDAMKSADSSSASGNTSSATNNAASASGNAAATNANPKRLERPSVTRGAADEIAASDFVKDYNYGVTTSANATNLEAVESSSAMPAFGGKGGGMFGQGDASNSGDFALSGINAYAFIDAVKTGQMTLSSGETFDEDDNDAVLISVELAEANDLEIGDKITLTNLYNSKNFSLVVRGIYDNASNFANANAIYMNIDTAGKFLEAGACGDDCKVENVSFSLNDPAAAQDFIAWIESNFPALAESKIVAREDTALYDSMVGPIENVGSAVTVILWIVIIAGVIVVSLIVIIDVKDRRYEMGVLLSLGGTKSTIVGQILCELILVGTVIFAASSITATAFAKVMGQGILDAQIAAAAEQAENNFGRAAMNKTGGKSAMPADAEAPSAAPSSAASGAKNPAAATAESAISEIDINARPADFLLLFVCGYAIIVAALLLPAVNILRYQPKSILQGKE